MRRGAREVKAMEENGEEKSLLLEKNDKAKEISKDGKGSTEREIDRVDENRVSRLVLVMVVLDTIVFSMCVPMFPRVVKSVIGRREWLWVQSCGNLAGAFAGPTLGWLSDKRGRKRIMTFSGLIGTSCCILMFTGSYMVARQGLILWSLLAIAGFVLRRMNRNIPLCKALVTDITTESVDRKARLSMIGGMYGMGFAIGPVIAGHIAERTEPSVVFAIAASLSLVNQVIIRWFIPDLARNKSKKKVTKEDQGFRQVLDIVRGKPQLWFLFVTTLANMLAQVAYNTSVPFAVQTRFGFDTRMYGLVVSTFGVFFSGTQLVLLPRLTKVVESDEKLLLGSLLMNSITRMLIAYGKSPWLVYVTHACFAVGNATNNFVLTNLITKNGKEIGLVGSLLGLQDTMNRFSGILAPSLLSFLPDAYITAYAGDVYTGAFISSCLYTCAAVLVFSFSIINQTKHKPS